MITQDKLNALYDELADKECESNGEYECTKDWQKLLKKLGCDYQISYDWKEWGAVAEPLIDLLEKYAKCKVLEDPQWEGSDGGTILIFNLKKRRKRVKAKVRNDSPK